MQNSFFRLQYFCPEHTQTKCKEKEIRFKKDISFYLHKHYVDLTFSDITYHFVCATRDHVRLPELQKLNIERRAEN
jgi:hypothetical protein